MRISDWSSDVCSSDLDPGNQDVRASAQDDQGTNSVRIPPGPRLRRLSRRSEQCRIYAGRDKFSRDGHDPAVGSGNSHPPFHSEIAGMDQRLTIAAWTGYQTRDRLCKSEEHTSELQSLMRKSYDDF